MRVARITPGYHPIGDQETGPQCMWDMGMGEYTPGYRTDKILRQGKNPHNCQRRASIRMGSEVYCNQHAEKRALEYLLEETKRGGR